MLRDERQRDDHLREPVELPASARMAKAAGAGMIRKSAHPPSNAVTMLPANGASTRGRS